MSCVGTKCKNWTRPIRPDPKVYRYTMIRHEHDGKFNVFFNFKSLTILNTEILIFYGEYHLRTS